MAVNLVQGFNITGTYSIDARFVLTKAEMLAINDNVMPNKYFALCSDDNKIYYYDKSKTANGVTGKFEPIESTNELMIRGYYLNNKFYTNSTYTVECAKDTKYIYVDANTGDLYTWNGTQYNKSVKDASEAQAGIMKLYDETGTNEDGSVTQKCFTDEINDKVEIDVDTSEEMIIFATNT